MWDSWANQFKNGSTGPFHVDPKLKQFITDNDKWLRSQVSKATDNKEFWHQVGLLMKQADALYAVSGENIFLTDHS